MVETLRDTMRKQCNDKGIHWAKANLPGLMQNEIGPIVSEWIHEYDERERSLQEAEHRRLSEEAIAAARDAAEVSRQSAVASAKSARWTMIAAFAAAASALISLAQALHWLP